MDLELSYYRTVKHPEIMERFILLSTALVLATIGNAQLSPQAEAPLCRHMLEVNKEWRSMSPAHGNAERMVHFNTEAERIALHLLVEKPGRLPELVSALEAAAKG